MSTEADPSALRPGADQKGQAQLARENAYVRGLARPHKNLMALYFLRALATLVGFPIAVLVLYFKYHTLKYRFDEEGVSVSWGILFRREDYLTYRKIQDIHVKRSLLERWLSLGTVEVQTASGSAGAEMQLEGLEDYEAVRDFFYRRMRGLEEDEQEGAAPGADAAAALAATAATTEGEAEALRLLGSVRDELVATRRALEASGAARGGEGA